MPKFQLILNSFGLAGLKPAVYRAFVGDTSPAGSGTEFPAQGDNSAGHITGEGSDANPKSWFGTPVFADVRFNRDGDDPIKLDTVLVDVSQRKNIVTTAVQGRNGTVKEYVSDGDYEVRIRGAIVNTGDNRYPSAEVRDLHALLSKSEALPIVADYLRLFNIYSVVVTDYSFPQQEGFQNVQIFEITAISDTPEELVREDE